MLISNYERRLAHNITQYVMPSRKKDSKFLPKPIEMYLLLYLEELGCLTRRDVENVIKYMMRNEVSAWYAIYKYVLDNPLS